MIEHCVLGNMDEAYKVMAHLWKLGYSSEDIIGIVFRVAKNHTMPEFLKLEFIKVIFLSTLNQWNEVILFAGFLPCGNQRKENTCQPACSCRITYEQSQFNVCGKLYIIWVVMWFQKQKSDKILSEKEFILFCKVSKF